MLPLTAHEFALGFDKYDIAADLDDAAPWEHIVILAPEQPEQLRAPRRDEGDDAPLGVVKLYIADLAEAEARVYIDDLLIPQLGKIAHHAMHPPKKVYMRGALSYSWERKVLISDWQKYFF